MEQLRSFAKTKKALLISSGIVCVSAGTYFVYKKLYSGSLPRSKAEDAPENAYLPNSSVQPSENEDQGDYDEGEISRAGRRVLVLGLQEAGKSCLLAALSSEGEPKEYQTTLGLNVVCIGTNTGPRLDFMEVGGSDKYRKYWGSFVKDIDVLLYVIDSCKEELLPESLDALDNILQTEGLGNIPIIILFSKEDQAELLKIERMILHLKDERFKKKNFKFSCIQVKNGGAPKTEGVAELLELIQECN